MTVKPAKSSANVQIINHQNSFWYGRFVPSCAVTPILKKTWFPLMGRHESSYITSIISCLRSSASFRLRKNWIITPEIARMMAAMAK